MTGPFLYDDGPDELHTGAPRRRQGLLLAIFGGTVLVAVLVAVLLPLVKGSGGEQAREVVQVFLTALDKGDNDTAFQLLCDAERADLAPADMGAKYLGGDGAGAVGAATEGEVDGGPVQRVKVDWPGGSTTTITVVNADGPHVCGVTPQG
jgi:hypothetical protein